MPKFSFSPDEEYSIQDLTLTVVKNDGSRFPFSQGQGDQRIGLLEDAMYDAQEKSGVMKGSGPHPRAHLRTVDEPKCELTMPVDTAAKLKKFVGRDGIVDVICTRRVPDGSAVTDRVIAWKPLFAGPSFKSGDASTRKVTGAALRIDEDVKNVLA